MADTEDRAVPEYSGKWWLNELSRAGKELDERWRTGADKVVLRYLDRREDDLGDDKSKYNIFWANTQILKSALYATPPKPSVTRTNADAKDDAGRVAAMMLERIIGDGITKDDSDMHNAIKAAVEDRLIPGLGMVWLRYEAETEKYIVPETGQEAERVTKESAPCDYVHWRDFQWSPARTWDEVWWVSRRVWMKKKKFAKRFGEDKYKEVKTQAEAIKDVEGAAPKGFSKGRIEVYEVWCQETEKVYWVSSVLEENLDERDDPLGLDNFFPCPPPLLATHTTNDVTPRPDYVMMQDQYTEIDTLNDRINTLTKALRVVGVYDKNNAELAKMLTGSEFAMIAVDNWAMLAEAGGLKGQVDWFPVEVVAGVLEKLSTQRQVVVGQLYELSGISDIMRGNSNARETAKAQTLKAQYSSVRLQLVQQDVGRFVRHALQIKSEIVRKHFQPQTILEQSQIMYSESAILAPQAIQVLKDYKEGQHRIEVNEEQLSLADYNAERELRIEYVTGLGQFLSQSAGLIQEMPGSLPFVLKIVQWVTAAFRGSADIETVLDEAIKAAQQMPPKQEEKAPPDHSVEVAQVKARVDTALAQTKARADVQISQADNETKLQIARMDNDIKLKIAGAQIRAKAEEKPAAATAVNVDGTGLGELVAPLAEAVEAQAVASKEMQEAVTSLIGVMSRPKVRRPVKDKAGEIVEVHETLGE